jgi:hypothetical protein
MGGRPRGCICGRWYEDDIIPNKDCPIHGWNNDGTPKSPIEDRIKKEIEETRLLNRRQSEK